MARNKIHLWVLSWCRSRLSVEVDQNMVPFFSKIRRGEWVREKTCENVLQYSFLFSWSKTDDDCKFCICCDCKKSQRADFAVWSLQFRTELQNMFNVPVERIVFCTLHAKMRITGKLLKLLAQEASDAGKHLDLIAAVRSAGWRKFDVVIPDRCIKVKIPGLLISDEWLIRNAGVTGAKCSKVLEHYKDIVTSVTTDADTLQIWEDWKWICEMLQEETVESTRFSDIEAVLQRWGDNYVNQYCDYNVTPYIHTVVCHTLHLLKLHNSIGLFSQQGFEATHKWHKRLYYTSTSHDGSVSTRKVSISSIQQLFLKIFRVLILQLRIDFQQSEALKELLNCK